MLYCLDSSVIIDILRGDASLLAKLEALSSRQSQICITPIVLAELFKGAYLAERQKEALQLVEDFVHSVALLEFNEESAKSFGQKYAELQKQGKQTQEADLMIACIALVHEAIVVTRNKKDFVNISGLKLIEW